ncbi:MAG: 6-hydroxymethylpterin diphosphokinase MptE-like protein [Pseudomonadota bacterium]
MAEGTGAVGIATSGDDEADAARLEPRYQAALDRVPFKAGIYLPTDRVPPEQRAAGMERVADIHNGPVKTVYRDQLQALRKRHIGQRRAFIIGNGPSLNETDLSQLAGEVTFCVNSFFLKMPELDWTPTYYVVEDHLVAEDRAGPINALKGLTKLFPAYLAYCLEPGEDTIFFNHRARKRFPDAFDFSTDASTITYTGCTVTFTCMQLAHYMGFQEIYLIGVDASYDIPKDVEVDESQGSTAVLDMASEDPNHFHPDYFGKGMRWHDPQVDKMLEAYAEARRVADSSGRPIYNATVGGALEVFERRSFARVFPAAVAPGAMAVANTPETEAERTSALAAARSEAATVAATTFPRVVRRDVVPPGQMTATGELKSTLFGDWPDDRLMQIALDRHRLMAQGGGLTPGTSATAAFTDDVLAALVEDFAPELVIFRPVPDRDRFNGFAFDLVEGLDVPVALWIVDDWPAHLEKADPDQWAWLGPRFAALVSRAAAHFAISDAMAAAFETRYGKPFEAFSNAVDRRDWPAPVPAEAPADADEPFRIRYSGGLSSKMTLQSVLDLAEAVEMLPDGAEVRFEINTRDHWAAKYGDRFAGYSRTILTTEEMPPAQYRAWLRGADLTAILYNFDAATVDYVRHSMANKTAECLASGAPPLVYGPAAIHTVDYLETAGLGVRVDGQGVDQLAKAVKAAMGDRDAVRAKGEVARAFVFEHRGLEAEQARFRAAIEGAAVYRPAPGEAPQRAALNEAYRARVLAADEPAPAVPAALGAVAPRALRGSRVSRIVWFYTGWRGALAGGAMLLPLLAFLAHAVLAGGPSLLPGLFAASGSGALAVVFFFIGYLFSLIEDYSPAGRPPV